MTGPWEDFADDTGGPWEDFAPEAAPKAKRKRNIYGEVAGAVANFNRGIGIGDEIVAGARTVGGLLSGDVPVAGLLSAFKDNMAAQRTLEDEYAADRPVTSGLLKGTGMAGVGLIPAGGSAGLLASSPRWLNIGRGVVGAATSAAGYSAVDRGTVRERLANASAAATDPLVLGLGAAGGAVAPAAGKAKVTEAPAPTLDELKAAKNAAYSAVDQAGIRYKPEAVDTLVDNITADMAAGSLNATRHPKAASMLEDLAAMRGQSPTLTELDQLRQVIRRDVANATDAADAHFGQRMIRKLDEFIDGAGPADVAEGSAEDATRLLREARDLNTRARKVEDIETGLEEARYQAGRTGSGGNINNAVRQQMDKIRRDTPNLTDDEAAMLEKIIIGTKGQNALRQVGKLSPQGNGLMTALSIGGAAANPLLAIPTVAGAVSKTVADNMTQSNVRELVDMIARGGSPAAKQALSVAAEADPALAAILQEVSARLSRAGGVAAAPRGGVESIEIGGQVYGPDGRLISSR